MDIDNKISLGSGLYTVSDISQILRIPYFKVRRWLEKYWDGELGEMFKSKYSTVTGKSKAVNFLTLVEFHILYQFGEKGVKTRQIINAHKELSKAYNTAFPFADKRILNNLKTDGLKIYLKKGKEVIVTLDGTQQLNLNLIENFFKKLDFNNDQLAKRYWPLGKKKSIVIDPHRKFGHPVIGNTNIYPETVYNMYKAKEPIKFIAFTYQIEESQVKDAIEYCKAA